MRRVMSAFGLAVLRRRCCPRLAVGLCGLSLVACATTGQVSGEVRGAATPSAGQGSSARPEAVIEVAPVVVSPYSDDELALQFEKGRALLLASKFREARDVFERLVRLSPDGLVAPPSLLNLGILHEELGERDVAASNYKELLSRFPAHETARGARVRLARLLGYLERWTELVELADVMLGVEGATVLETVEARGAKALGLIEQDRLDLGEREVMKARDLIEEHRLGDAGRPPIELAPVSFALGEVRRSRSEKIRFSPLPPNFTDVFEQRCQGLLDAQSAYMDAMRALDAHWSAMAGYRIGQLYEQLHRDVMQITPPSAPTLKKKQLFEGAMRVRYRILLEKGLKMMAGVVQMGERTGEASLWIGRAKEARRRLEDAIAEEREALSKLPFTEAELQAALNNLKTP